MSNSQELPAAPDLESIAAFLDGSAPLDGVWFGDRHPTLPGAFWWRSMLKAALGAKRAAEARPLGAAIAPEHDEAMRAMAEKALREFEALRADADRYRWLKANMLWRVTYRIRPGKSKEFRMLDDEGDRWGNWWPTHEQAVDHAIAATKELTP